MHDPDVALKGSGRVRHSTFSVNGELRYWPIVRGWPLSAVSSTLAQRAENCGDEGATSTQSRPRKGWQQQGLSDRLEPALAGTALRTKGDAIESRYCAGLKQFVCAAYDCCNHN